jgi:hypothetical protein
MHHFDEPVYMISIVAKILDIHPDRPFTLGWTYPSLFSA